MKRPWGGVLAWNFEWLRLVKERVGHEVQEASRGQIIVPHRPWWGYGHFCSVWDRKSQEVFEQKSDIIWFFFFFNLLWLWLKTEGEGGIRDNKKVNSGGKKMVLDLGVIADIIRSSQSLDFEWSRVNRICWWTECAMWKKDRSQKWTRYLEVATAMRMMWKSIFFLSQLVQSCKHRVSTE